MRLCAGALACVIASCGGGPASSTISVNPSITHQTFAGWESVVLSSVLDYKSVLAAYGSVLDAAVTDLGITRVQIAVASGIEHPPGYAEHYLNRTMSEHTYFTEHAYDIVNDNADPNVADMHGFDFTLLDWQIENVILPFLKRVEASGHKPYAYLSYGDVGKSGFKHYQDPAEYAEFMLVLFDHIKTRFGFVPDGVNVVNEPDTITGWTGAMMGAAIAAAGPRLAGAGYHPDFTIPSTMDRSHAVPYFQAAIAVDGAREYVKELSYHCYADTGFDSAKRIGDASVRFGVRTVMNECWNTGNTYKTLHDDLKRGRNSAWQQGVFVGPHGYYRIDRDSQPALNAKTWTMRQYYKYIRPGARRIDATAVGAGFDPLAFINADGGYAIVLKARSHGSCTIEHLPDGTYSISYSTDSEYDVHLDDVTVTGGQAVRASIPAPGVITVYSARAPFRSRATTSG